MRFIGRARLVEVEVSWSRAGADSLPGFGELMDVQGEGGHCSFTDNTSLLTDLHKPTNSDKLTLQWIMMMAGFFCCVVTKNPGTEMDVFVKKS